ncbi:hypothetical protein ACFX13_030080 [Malus domestica]|uniref:uncharacterized protein C24B11.05 isoform X1 n=1 Tax=Malus domestica TaxID=3750 RepID=UPI0004987957|nr:uncharacterized protein LOC103420671 isoform X1 [Malus domestica]XP_050140934.1 uncharacterized protein LOC126616849 isoform X1 [Malus sylvestris]
MEFQNQFQEADQMPKYECLLFDLDDTLYPLSSGLSDQCTKNIEEFMVQKLGIEEKRVTEVNQVLYKNYGTSIAGLKAIGYNFDNEDYHSFVHGRLPYENLRPDPVLRTLLLSLPYRKLIFSNGNNVHVAKTLSKLGLDDCFEGVISFETLNPTKDDEGCSTSVFDRSCLFDAGISELPATPIVCKPFANAYEQAFKKANINPQRTIFFDDSLRNIQTGKNMGLHTVLVGSSNRTKGVDYAIESIHNIREALPELWEIDNKNTDTARTLSGKLAMEKSVTAEA